MKNAKKIIILFLTVFMMLNIAPVRAADEGFSDGGEIPVYEPGPILEEPEDHSGETVTDDHAEVRLGSLMSSPMRRKLQEAIDSLLNYQPIDMTTVNNTIYAIDDFLQSGGYYSGSDVSEILQGSGELSVKARRIGLQNTGDDLIEVDRKSVV